MIESLTQASVAALVGQGPVTIDFELNWFFDQRLRADVCTGVLHFIKVETLVQRRIKMKPLRRIDDFKVEPIWRTIKKWWNKGCNDLVSHEEIRRIGCKPSPPGSPTTTSQT